MERSNIFGQRIRALRKGLKLTQEQVAKQLNISVAALSRYEKGSFEPKSLALIVDLAMLYKVSTDYLLGKTDLKNPELDFDKLDIGLSSKTYETLTDKQKEQIKKIMLILVGEDN
ncbi:MAG: helix-turn-helix domain-containing protein [Clostridia bacterium]|nr:helix-turn-helix domain-containing protein [Clostridia bacterium]